MNIFKKFYLYMIIIFVYMQTAYGKWWRISAKYITTDNEVSQFTGNISAASAILINAETSEILYAKNENERRATSTTKIMSAILTIEAGELDKKFTVDDYAINVGRYFNGIEKGWYRYTPLVAYALPWEMTPQTQLLSMFPVALKVYHGWIKGSGLKLIILSLPQAWCTKPYTTASDLAKLTAYALKNLPCRNLLTKLKIKFGNPVSPLA